MTDHELMTALSTQLTVPVWPHTGKAFHLSRNKAYEAAKRGDIPTIKIGGAIRVPTAALRKMLGMDTPAPVTGKAA